ncbi:MAG: hydroxymethylglutaryl-CoA reductase, partial [Xanthomonadales bacterium]|nr:hydroxymethylglutaryl-CoA reductase [Xanthomonadales bacterium]NIX14163.1 hydroxymethylglutaryl-CoA reductase [Xanthomonadales bacterium]
MKLLPGRVLRKMYNHASLRNTGNGVRFSVKNRLSPVSLQQISRVSVNGDEIPATRLRFSCNERSSAPVSDISPEHPLNFPLGTRLTLDMDIEPLRPGRHGLEVAFSTRPYGRLRLEVTDVLNTGDRNPAAIPRDPDDDYARKVIAERQAFIERRTGAKLEHTARFSIDPAVTRGNIENFIGAAQVPLGYAGPLRVEGQHACGEFYIPLATSEGTLVASYNRGMKVLHRSGGVKCTVVGDHMQRAPAFVFRDAARAREFADWLVAHTGEVKAAADATDPFVSMTYIDHYLA